MNHLIAIARTATFAGLVATGLALSAPAFAADSDAPPQGTLTLHGADLTSPRAVAQLKRQLHHVAMTICTPNSGGRIFMSHDEQKCYDTAVNDGLAQINNRQQQALRDRTVRLAAAPTNATSN